ncbi:antizyme inhibitor 2-like isoform X3 [Pleurodeles waltl]|uniref:antizyme inhibitor 2-like isoform X3 n=1 Tax=Pleurodeles waltl TaxID=8319 RepID=UPI0037095E7C
MFVNGNRLLECSITGEVEASSRSRCESIKNVPRGSGPIAWALCVRGLWGQQGFRVAVAERKPAEMFTLMEGERSAQDVLEQMILERSLSDDREAFMVADLGEVVKKHWHFQEVLPRVKPFYSVKSNDSKEVIQTLAKLGTDFDCTSKGEIELVLGLGVSPDRIIYANPCKQLSHIKYAASSGVKMMTFDSEEELTKVAQCHPTARMLLRIKTDDSKSCGHLSSKFGAPLEACRHILEEARQLGITVVGVSFHVGSRSKNLASFTQAIADAHTVFQTGIELGHHMQVLDIGGGFPGIEDAQPSFEEMGAVVTSELCKHFPEGCGVEIIAEPGRFYVTSAFTAALNVIAKKTIVENWSKHPIRKKIMYYLNDGIFGSFNFLLFEENHLKPLIIHKACLAQSLYPSTLWGQTLDGNDKIMDDVALPELQVGDWLVFRNIGAYSVTTTTLFNAFTAMPIYFLLHKDTWTALGVPLTPNKH